MRLILLVFLFFGVAQADSFFDNGWPIYIYGDTDYVASVFNAIAMIAQSDTYMYIIWIAVTILIPLSAYVMFRAGNFVPLVGGVAWALGGTLLAINPAVMTEVKIMDKRVDYGVVDYGATPSFQSVSNIPILIAVPASISTLVSYQMTNLIDTALSSVDPNVEPYNRLGFMQNYALGDELLKFASFDNASSATFGGGAVSTCNSLSRWNSCYQSYVQECVVHQAIGRDSNVFNTLLYPQKSVSYIEQISPTALNLLPSDGMYHNSIPYSCKTFYDNYLFPHAASAAAALESRINKVLTNKNISTDPAVTGDMLDKIYGYGGNTVLAGTTQLQDYFLTRAMGEASAKALAKAQMGEEVQSSDFAANLNSRMSFEDDKARSLMSLQKISDMFPLVVFYLQAISWFLGIFIVPIALYKQAKGGMILIANYFGGLFMLALMTPALAIVHHFANFYGRGDLDIIYDETRAGAPGADLYLYSYMNDMQGIAAILGIAVVFTIPSLILSGQVGKLTNVALNTSAGGLQDAANKLAEQKARHESGNQHQGMATVSAKQQMIDNMNKLSWNQVASQDNNMNNIMRGASHQGMNAAGQQIGYGQHSDAFSAQRSGEIEGAGQAGQQSGTAHSITPGQSYMTKKAAASTEAISSIEMLAARQGEGLLDAQGLGTDKMRNSMRTNHGRDARELAIGGELTDSQRADYIDGAGEIRKKSQGETAGFAKNADSVDSYEAGRRSGEKNRAGFDEGFKADRDRGVFGSDGELTRTARQGFYNNASEEVVSILSKCVKSFSNDDWNEKIRSGGTQYKGSFEDAKGFNEATSGKNADGNDREENYLQARRDKSNIDTASMVGGTQGKADELTRAGDKLQDAAEKLARTTEGANTRATLSKIQTAGGEEGFKSFSAMDAVNKTDERLKSLQGDMIAGKIGSSGALTQLGAEGVIQTTASKSAESMKRAQNLSSQEIMNEFAHDAISRGQTLAERKKIAKDMLEDGALQQPVKFDEQGNIDKSSLKASTGADMAVAFGRGEGNRYTDRLGGAYWGGYEVKGGKGAVSATSDNSSNNNTSQNRNESINYVGQVSRKIHNMLTEEMGMTNDEANALIASGQEFGDWQKAITSAGMGIAAGTVGGMLLDKISDINSGATTGSDGKKGGGSDANKKASGGDTHGKGGAKKGGGSFKGGSKGAVVSSIISAGLVMSDDVMNFAGSAIETAMNLSSGVAGLLMPTPAGANSELPTIPTNRKFAQSQATNAEALTQMGLTKGDDGMWRPTSSHATSTQSASTQGNLSQQQRDQYMQEMYDSMQQQDNRAMMQEQSIQGARAVSQQMGEETMKTVENATAITQESVAELQKELKKMKHKGG
jgi:hypothetical protein